MERNHKEIVEMSLTLLAHASIPIIFWDHSYTTFVFLFNRLPAFGLSKFISLYISLYNKQPEYMSLKLFGCSCFPLLSPYNQHKLQFKSNQYVYLGVSPTHKGHKYLIVEGRIFISKDVKFNENQI